MHTLIFNIIIAIVVFSFVLDRTLEYLNLKHLKPELPPELKDIYDEAKYKKSQEYERETSRFGLISSSISFVVTLLMFLFEGFAYIQNLSLSIVDHPILTALIFFGILMFASDIIGIPFAIYSTFVIEEKYGFNKTTPKIFVLDHIKGWLLGAILGGGILSLIIWFYMLTQDSFWLYTWLFTSFFSIFMAMFYSTLIVPLFNKQTPLAEGELRNAIEKFSTKAGFKLTNIFVIDGSKRSTKANAYFSGLGAKKRIVLYDTLINDLSTDEIVAVLAHEIGHYKKKHIVQSIVYSVISSGVIFYILSFFISNPNFSLALGVEQPAFHIALITLGILYTPLSEIMGLFMNVRSRKNEFEADNFAVQHQMGEHLASGLKKLSVNNLSNLTPHPAYVFMYYSHPPLLKRLQNLMK